MKILHDNINDRVYITEKMAELGVGNFGATNILLLVVAKTDLVAYFGIVIFGAISSLLQC